MKQHKIKPEFTEAQAGEIRIALTEALQFRLENNEDRKEIEDALEELDRAHSEAEESNSGEQGQ